MNFRSLGKTGLKISEIGLGTEYLNNQPLEIVKAVIHRAIQEGVNYFDLVYTFREYLDNLAIAFKGYREKIIITGHLGSAETNGKYRRTRDIEECRIIFLKMLSRLGIKYVDILFIQFVVENEYKDIIGPNGLLNLALQFQKEGKTKFIGVSTHNVSVGLKVANNKKMDVLMFPINLAMHAMPGRNDLFMECAKQEKGLVAMKPFAGGKLFQKNKTIIIPKYQTGNKTLKRKIQSSITPIKCISYINSYTSVSTVVPGVKNLEELEATLKYINSSINERDFFSILTKFKDYKKGECIYCNHCLPCPAGIDIGRFIRLIDLIQKNNIIKEKINYSLLITQASSCIECGACMERCPFEVDIISKIKLVKKKII